VRLAIFGGSFDPPHIGHLLAAQDAFDQLSLDRLILVPAATQPLKTGREATDAPRRLDMARLLVEGDSRFEVSSVEVDRGGLSFTVDTLAHFAREFPDAERFFLIGADVLASFGQWREPHRVVALARLAILERAGDQPPMLPSGLDERRLTHLPTRRVDVSSTDIRERVRQGRSIRGFVTDGVAAYIARAGLYR
jgi:nicotinate-nucleotide adenylyltransferase